jgi:hypothetical protein
MEVSIKRIGNKIKALILRPASFWKSERIEPTGTQQLITGYFLPLVLMAGFAEFAGQLLKGSGFYLMFPLMRAMREVLLFLLVFVFSVFLSNQLVKTFGGKKDLPAIRRLVIFSLMPVLLISIVTNLFPFLYVLEILGFYSFFIFMSGVEELLIFPDNKRNRYILIALMSNFFIYSFLSIFLSQLVTSFI